MQKEPDKIHDSIRFFLHFMIFNQNNSSSISNIKDFWEVTLPLHLDLYLLDALPLLQGKI